MKELCDQIVKSLSKYGKVSSYGPEKSKYNDDFIFQVSIRIDNKGQVEIPNFNLTFKKSNTEIFVPDYYNTKGHRAYQYLEKEPTIENIFEALKNTDLKKHKFTP